MGRACSVRTDYSSGEVRRLARRVKHAGQARRLLAIAAVLDGSTREDAALVAQRANPKAMPHCVRWKTTFASADWSPAWSHL